MAKGKEKQPPQSFEEKFRALEEIVEQMEREDLPLEELLDKFEQGVGYLRELRQFLQQARQRVERFVELTDQGPVLKEFALPEEEAELTSASSQSGAEEEALDDADGEDEESEFEDVIDDELDQREGGSGGIFD